MTSILLRIRGPVLALEFGGPDQQLSDAFGHTLCLCFCRGVDQFGSHGVQIFPEGEICFREQTVLANRNMATSIQPIARTCSGEISSGSDCI